MRILFWFDKQKTDPQLGQIACSVLLNDRESYFTTGLVLKKADWGGNKKRVLSSRKDFLRLNAELSQTETKLEQIYDGLRVLIGHTLIEPKMIAEAYKFFERPENETLRPDKEGLRLALEGRFAVAPTLLEVLENHKKNKARFVSGETVITYRTRIKNLRAFLKSVNRLNLAADEFRPVWCKKFTDYMYEKEMHPNHIARHIVFFREALDEAVTDEIIAFNPMGKFSVKRSDVKDLRHLHPVEIEKLEQINFAAFTQKKEYAQKLSTTRDIFLFLIYTTMHISDYLALTIEHVQTRKTGLWLIKPRNKTKQKAHIKIEGKLLDMWTKYGGVRGLPKQSVETVNKYLKVIEQMCGFRTDGLSTKIGRKTGTNKMLNHDRMDKDDIALVMGLKSTRHIDDYAETTILRLENKI